MHHIVCAGGLCVLFVFLPQGGVAAGVGDGVCCVVRDGSHEDVYDPDTIVAGSPDTSGIPLPPILQRICFVVVLLMALCYD
eukprot:scaffold123816_cov48-Prasinocladus_malaysianus.AAC.2